MRERELRGEEGRRFGSSRQETLELREERPKTTFKTDRMYSRRLTSCSRALAFAVVGARALAFLGLGVGVACGDMKGKEIKLEEIAVSHTLCRQYRKRGTKGWKEEKQKILSGT